MITYFIMRNLFYKLTDTPRTISNDENFKGCKNASFWMVVILWAITLPICWFAIPIDFTYHHIMVIVGCILELILAIFSELEHTTIMHDAAGNFEDNPYYWWKAGFCLSLESIVVFGIFIGILHSSVLLIYIIMTLLIIWLPRLMFKSW